MSPRSSRQFAPKSAPLRTASAFGIGTNTCSPSDPDVFGTPTAPTFASSSRSQRATSSTVSNEVPGIGSRSKATWSGAMQRLHAREPGVLRDGRQLRHVEQRLERPADRAARHVVVRQHLDTDAGRHLVGRAMLVERLAAHAVRIPLHHQGPIRHDRQDERRDLHVVAHQVAFGEALGGQNILWRLLTSSESPSGSASAALALRAASMRCSWSMTRSSAGVPVCRGAGVRCWGADVPVCCVGPVVLRAFAAFDGLGPPRACRGAPSRLCGCELRGSSGPSRASASFTSVPPGSRRTAFGSTSSRNPRYAGWRSLASSVHSVKRTWPTNWGFTQWGVSLVIGGGTSKGDVLRCRGCERLHHP